MSSEWITTETPGQHLTGPLKEKETLRGRPKETWRKTVEKERKQLGFNTWAETTRQAQDRSKWRGDREISQVHFFVSQLHYLGTVNFSNKYITQKLNSAGGLLVPEGISRPVVSDSGLGG